MTTIPVRSRPATAMLLCFSVVVLAGCDALTNIVPGKSSTPTGGTSEQPEQYIVWGDPITSDTHPLIRDVNNIADRGILVGTDGRVVFSINLICTDCTVEGPYLSLDGEPAMAFRFGPDRDGADIRRPYLVSNDEDGHYIQLVSENDAITFQKTSEPFEQLAGELVVWGDPAGDAQSTEVYDADDDAERFVRVGTDGFVQFFDGSICGDCDVDGSTIGYTDDLTMSIRFGPSQQGNGALPFLVSNDGFLVRLVADNDGITFEVTDTLFEDPDDASDDLAEEDDTEENSDPGDYPGDDLAVEAGVVDNPSAATTAQQNPLQALACGPSMVLFVPLTAMSILLLRLARRR